MKKIKNVLLSAALVFGLVALPLTPSVVGAQAANPSSDIGKGVEAIGGKSGGGATEFNTQVRNIVNLLLFLLGIIAVIAIIIGGFRYVTSNGEAGNIKTAKDIILYAVIGLVVAILAYAIVNFVVSAFAPK